MKAGAVGVWVLTLGVLFLVSQVIPADDDTLGAILGGIIGLSGGLIGAFLWADRG